jgi:hypothetical protein
MIKWHRLLALVLEDLFTGSGYRVEVEIDLSRKQQFLDAVIVEHDRNLPLPSPLPDGLDNLAAHNLITYKSLHEPLDAWVLYELIGHYSNYRKLLADPESKKMPPEEDFRLYAVAARYPQKLAKQTAVRRVRAGVYRVQWGPLPIRLIVPWKSPDTPRNAVWAMLSGNIKRILKGESQYEWHDPDKSSSFIHRLHEAYSKEGINMPYTLEDFLRHDREDWLQSLPPEELRKTLSAETLRKALSPEERLKGLPPAEVLKVLPPEERLKGLSSEEVLKSMSPEERLKGLPPETLLQAFPPELLKALPPEEIKAWLARQESETGH